MPGSKLIKIMQDAGKLPASESTDLLLGEVTSTSPLKVKVDNRYEVGENFLVLTSLVSDFEVEMTINHQTGSYTHTHTITDTYSGGGSASSNTHSHSYSGRKKFNIHLGLKVGEKVLLLRVQKGQKFIIIDRAR